MAIPIKGRTQANGAPKTFYEYEIETSNRTSTKVHVKLKVWLRLNLSTSYYSFRIAHECKINGVYQYANIKTTRRFWGHQWEGSYYGGGDFYWQYGDAFYDGRAWHGPFTVFDGDVPMGVNDDTLNIIPCLTVPPITGLGGSGIYGWNAEDVTNWKGKKGVWRPFGKDEMRGSYKNTPCPEDGAFLNNRNLEPLSPSSCKIGAYPRPNVVNAVNVSPSSIDVAYQETTPVTAKWAKATRATKYDVYLSRNANHSDAKKVSTTTNTSIVLYPVQALKIKEFFADDKVYVGVASIDSMGVASSSIRWSSAITYFERLSKAPTSLKIVGHKGTDNDVLYKGEQATIYYSGQSDGSYPIETLQLYRPSDGWNVSWQVNDAENDNNIWSIVKDIGGISTPNQTEQMQIRAYNTKGRPAYASGNSWTTIDVFYYGGLIYIFDEMWHEGLCYVYVDGEWHEADAVYVNTPNGWKTI